VAVVVQVVAQRRQQQAQPVQRRHQLRRTRGLRDLRRTATRRDMHLAPHEEEASHRVGPTRCVRSADRLASGEQDPQEKDARISTPPRAPHQEAGVHHVHHVVEVVVRHVRVVVRGHGGEEVAQHLRAGAAAGPPHLRTPPRTCRTAAPRRNARLHHTTPAHASARNASAGSSPGPALTPPQPNLSPPFRPQARGRTPPHAALLQHGTLQLFRPRHAAPSPSSPAVQRCAPAPR
jgi:hypothetical protein